VTEDIRTNVVLMGRYQVQRELGRGGMGAVYLAFDLQHRKSVAIKVARLGGAEARAQFRREALYLQKLTHHSLPRVLDVFSDTQRDFLVMEYIPGDDLEALVRQQGPQPEWLVLRWADELLDVLDYLHTQDPPIIHRDVKPGNLKLRENGTVVLVDFGIAAERRPEHASLVGMTAVTPGYSPPEQYSDSPADARTDVYGAGATLYYLLTGVAPAAAPERASEAATLAPARKLVAKTSAHTDALLSKALNLAGEERWANAAEMRRAAAVASRKLASAAPPAPLPDPSLPAGPVHGIGTEVPAGKRRVGMAAVLGLLGVALLAAAVLLWTIGGRQPGLASPTPSEATGAPGDQASAATATAAALAGMAEPSPTLTEAPSAPTAARAAQPEPGEAQAAQKAAISTAIPTRTPVNAPSTSTPEAPTQPSPTSPGAATSPAATPAAPAADVTVALQEPNDGDTRSGDVLFRWNVTAGSLPVGMGYQVFFYQPGQDPLRDGFTVADPLAANSAQVNLAGLDADPKHPLEPGAYLWGVRIAPLGGGRAVSLVAEGRRIIYQRPVQAPPTNTPQPADTPVPPTDTPAPPPTDTPAPPPTDTPGPPPSRSFMPAAQPSDLRHAGAGGALGLGMFVVVLCLAVWRPRRLL